MSLLLHLYIQVLNKPRSAVTINGSPFLTSSYTCTLISLFHKLLLNFPLFSFFHNKGLE